MSDSPIADFVLITPAEEKHNWYDWMVEGGGHEENAGVNIPDGEATFVHSGGH